MLCRRDKFEMDFYGERRRAVSFDRTQTNLPCRVKQHDGITEDLLHFSKKTDSKSNPK